MFVIIGVLASASRRAYGVTLPLIYISSCPELCTSLATSITPVSCCSCLMHHAVVALRRWADKTTLWHLKTTKNTDAASPPRDTGGPPPPIRRKSSGFLRPCNKNVEQNFEHPLVTCSFSGIYFFNRQQRHGHSSSSCPVANVASIFFGGSSTTTHRNLNKYEPLSASTILEFSAPWSFWSRATRHETLACPHVARNWYPGTSLSQSRALLWYVALTGINTSCPSMFYIFLLSPFLSPLCVTTGHHERRIQRRDVAES